MPTYRYYLFANTTPIRVVIIDGLIRGAEIPDVKSSGFTIATTLLRHIYDGVDVDELTEEQFVACCGRYRGSRTCHLH